MMKAERTMNVLTNVFFIGIYIYPRLFPFHLSLCNVKCLAREIRSSAKANPDEVYYL